METEKIKQHLGLSEKEVPEKDDFLFNTHLFAALKAKSLEDYDGEEDSEDESEDEKEMK